MKIFISSIILIILVNVVFGQQSKKIEIKVFENEYILKDYDIFKINENFAEKVASFPKPTVSLLLEYRSGIKGARNHQFFESVEDVSSLINAISVKDSIVWIGFSFYEGEGWEGYGGIGFFNSKNNKVGILRHPALLNCSIDEIQQKNDYLYMKTVAIGELSTSSGNGIVVLNIKTLDSYSLLPFGQNLIFHKDDNKHDHFADRYNKPLNEIISDSSFKKKVLKDYTVEKKQKILSLGLLPYMAKKYEKEIAIRKDLLAIGRKNIYKNVLIDSSKKSFKYYTRTKKELFSIQAWGVEKTEYFWNITFNIPGTPMFNFFVFSPDNKKNQDILSQFYYCDVGKNSEIKFQNSKFAYNIALKDFQLGETKNNKKEVQKVFKSASFDIEVIELN